MTPFSLDFIRYLFSPYIRYLLDEWMDHYRMILNVTNPQLARVGSAVIATRHRTRLIKSAKPMLESGPDRPQSAAAMDFLPRPKLPMRAPSAPAVGRLHVSRPYSTMSMPSEQPKKDESQGRQSRVRIEVDGVDQGYYLRYSRGGSTISRFVFMLLYQFCPILQNVFLL